MPGTAVTVLGYLEKCDGCGATALLAEPIERPLFHWTCPTCDLRIDGPQEQDDNDPLGRAYALVSQFYEVLERLRQPTPEAAAEAVSDWHQAGYIDESGTAQQTANTKMQDAE